MQDIGKLYKNIRATRKITQAEASERSGLSAAYISRLENGDFKTVGVDKLFALARGVKTHPGYLINKIVGSEHPYAVSQILTVTSDGDVASYLEMGCLFLDEDETAFKGMEDFLEDKNVKECFRRLTNKIVERKSKLNDEKKTKEDPFFKTSDLYLTAALRAAGHNIDRINKITNKESAFVFKRTKHLIDDMEKYHSGELMSEPFKLYSQMNAVKSMLEQDKLSREKTGKGMFE